MTRPGTIRAALGAVVFVAVAYAALFVVMMWGSV